MKELRISEWENDALIPLVPRIPAGAVLIVSMVHRGEDNVHAIGAAAAAGVEHRIRHVRHQREGIISRGGRRARGAWGEVHRHPRSHTGWELRRGGLGKRRLLGMIRHLSADDDHTDRRRWRWCDRGRSRGHVAGVFSTVGYLENVGVGVETLDLLLRGAMVKLLVGAPVVTPKKPFKKILDSRDSTPTTIQLPET